MANETTNGLKAYVKLVSAIVLCCVSFVTVCAQRNSQTFLQAASLAQKDALFPTEPIALNNEPMGTTSDPSPLSKKLPEIFANRRVNHAYAIDMENRTDPEEWDRIERTVFVKADRSIKLGPFTRIVEAIDDAGAKPVLLPIEVEEEKAEEIFSKKPNPLTLVVRIGTKRSSSPSLSRVWTSGIPITLSIAPSGEALAVTIPKDGEYTIGEKHVDKAALEREIRERLKNNHESEKVVFIKAARDISYGSFEDVYYAAFAAGAKRIDLEKSINWEDQKIVNVPIADLTLTLPTELTADKPLIEPEKNGDITWTHYSYEWFKRPAVRGLTVNVFVTGWDKDFPPEAGGIPPDKMIERDYILTEKEKSTGQIEEVRYLELDGVKGVLYRAAPYADDKNRIWIGWRTFRYHRSKAQELKILVQGIRSDAERLMKVMTSAKLAQK